MNTSETSATSSPLMDRFNTYSKELTASIPILEPNHLRKLYREKPITMHKTYPVKNPMRWPKVIKAAYAAIWSGKYPRVIIKAPRGGGKSKLLGTVGFDLWYLKGRKVVTMGGSEVQAKIVYGYFEEYCGLHDSVADYVDGGTHGITMSKTTSVNGQEFSAVTASPKQIRGKHPDVLISDETCETSDELIDAALPMVNDSADPLVVMASTFHKIFGRFAETWDKASEMGYLRIQWDIFDVCAPFPADIWLRPEVARLEGIEKLQALAAGRTGDPDGWIRVESIIQAWREKPTEEWFEVEYMGTRPSSAGLVLKPEDVDSSLFDSGKETRYNFVQGATVVLGIDWGFEGMTAVCEVMSYVDGVKVLIDNLNFTQVRLGEIIPEIVKKVKAHGIRFIYADAEEKFANRELQNALSVENIGCAVIEVNFGTDKFGKISDPNSIGMLGNLRAYFEQHKVRLPSKFKDAYYQLKNYRYKEGTAKPLKQDDHIPDALMLALKHWSLAIVSRPLHVQLEKQPETKPDNNTTRYDPSLERRGPKPITAGNLNKKF